MKTFALCVLMALSGPSLVAQGQAAAKPAAGQKTLVVVYSRTGHTLRVGTELAKLLGADLEVLQDKKDRSGMWGYIKAGRDAGKEALAELGPQKYNPADYELVVMGTPVWNWTITPAIRTYITNNKAALKTVAFFTLAGSTRPERIVKKLEALSGKTAKASEGFYDKELKDANRAAYEAKLNAFAARIRQ